MSFQLDDISDLVVDIGLISEEGGYKEITLNWL